MLAAILERLVKDRSILSTFLIASRNVSNNVQSLRRSSLGFALDKHFKTDDIFNMGETGTIFKLLPAEVCAL